MHRDVHVVPRRWRPGCTSAALALCLALGACESAGSAVLDGRAADAGPALAEATAVLCSDGKDNDGDGFADCADQDCWVLAACARADGSARRDAAPDGPAPDRGGPTPDSGPSGDAAHDAAHTRCAIHWDCAQREFCYKGVCLRDPKQAVYHCGKPAATASVAPRK